MFVTRAGQQLIYREEKTEIYIYTTTYADTMPLSFLFYNKINRKFRQLEPNSLSFPFSVDRYAERTE